MMLVCPVYQPLFHPFTNSLDPLDQSRQKKCLILVHIIRLKTFQETNHPTNQLFNHQTMRKRNNKQNLEEKKT